MSAEFDLVFESNRVNAKRAVKRRPNLSAKLDSEKGFGILFAFASITSDLMNDGGTAETAIRRLKKGNAYDDQRSQVEKMLIRVRNKSDVMNTIDKFTGRIEQKKNKVIKEIVKTFCW